MPSALAILSDKAELALGTRGLNSTDIALWQSKERESTKLHRVVPQNPKRWQWNIDFYKSLLYKSSRLPGQKEYLKIPRGGRGTKFFIKACMPLSTYYGYYW